MDVSCGYTVVVIDVLVVDDGGGDVINVVVDGGVDLLVGCVCGWVLSMWWKYWSSMSLVV